MYWTYENWVHKYARVHRAECAHCNDGQGSHDVVDSRAGQWLGPFDQFGQALIASAYETQPCGHCSPTGDGVVEKPDDPVVGPYSEENIDAAISYAIGHCSATAVSYTDLFAAAGLQSPHWYFENGLRLVITQFMEAFHHVCARQGLPPFDAFIVNAKGSERAGYPGTGYFSINGLSDPLGKHTSDLNVRAAFAFRDAELLQIRIWCRDQH
jgi:hypothetical protein